MFIQAISKLLSVRQIKVRNQKVGSLELFADKSISCLNEILDETNTLSYGGCY
jgi:hypothetical protein